jgi:hypothetical protein
MCISERVDKEIYILDYNLAIKGINSSQLKGNHMQSDNNNIDTERQVLYVFLVCRVQL